MVTTRYTPVARLHNRLPRPVQRPAQRLVSNEQFFSRYAQLWAWTRWPGAAAPDGQAGGQA
eukprot:7948669-Lingulodinium_polyedra.AAC.1